MSNPNLQQNLLRARADLLGARENLATIRSVQVSTSLMGEIQAGFEAAAAKSLYRALDRVWDLQCMSEGSLR
jgi:hypothetical protein